MSFPILWWKAEDNPNESQAGVNAVWNTTPAYATGKVGKAFSFSFGLGDNYGLSTVNNALFNFAATDSFSIRLWLKLADTIIVNPATFVVKGLYAQNKNFGVGINTSNNLFFYYNNLTTVNTGYTITDTNWHDLLFTYANGKWNIYADSVNVTSATILAGTYLISNTNLSLIFAQAYYSDFQGLLDEIRIYDSVITPNNQDGPMVPTFQKLNLLTAKVQSALGSKATPAAADFITVDDNFSLDYKKEFAEQALAQGIFGNPQAVAGMSLVDVKVTLPIIPTGSATVPNVGGFLNCCGMVYALATKKHSWAPTSVIATNWKDMTLWGYTGDKTAGDTIITKAHSVMFDYEISGEVGKPCTITFTGKGVPDGAPAAGTYLTDTIAAISTVPPAVLKNATQTINGLALHILKFSVKGGNDVQMIKNMGDESGNLQSMIVNKKASWSVTAYMEDASSINPTTGMAAGTLATTTIKFGSAADSYISITSGSNKSEIRECKQSVDNGLMVWEITGSFVDNDFTVAINDA